MKILEIFNQYLDFGGEEKAADLIFNQIQELGYLIERVEVSSKEWSGHGKPPRIIQLKRMFSNEEFLGRLEEAFMRFQPDFLLLHNIYPVASPGVYKFALEKKIPVLQYIHNYRPFSVGGGLWDGKKVVSDGLQGKHLREVIAGSWQNSKIKSAVMAAVLINLKRQGHLRAVTRWIAISDFTRHKFVDAGICEGKIVTLKHSWPVTGDKRAQQEQDYYLFLGRLEPEKGINFLLDVWRLLERKLGSACPRLVIGGTGSAESTVKEALGHSDRVKYLGFVSGEEKDSLIGGCRAMLAPSIWWEPFGLIAYECYEHSRPIIAARSGGLTETVKDSVTGFQHIPDDINSLSDAVIKMEALDQSERRKMGEAGREWLLKEGCSERWKKGFQAIIEGH